MRHAGRYLGAVLVAGSLVLGGCAGNRGEGVLGPGVWRGDEIWGRGEGKPAKEPKAKPAKAGQGKQKAQKGKSGGKGNGKGKGKGKG